MFPFNLISKSIFSVGNIFLLILALIVGTFAMSAVNSALTYLGFETKQAVKTQLVETKRQLADTVKVNQENVKALEVERQVNLRIRVEIAKVNENVMYMEKLVTAVKEKKAKKDAPVIQMLAEKTVTTADNVTLPLDEINTLSASNIEQVHDVYKALFPTT